MQTASGRDVNLYAIRPFGEFCRSLRRTVNDKKDACTYAAGMLTEDWPSRVT
jgi:hypothetical protein